MKVRVGLKGLRRMMALITFAAICPSYAQSVPSDPDVACSIPASTVNGWFKSGTASLNGVVNPANSVSFPNTPNCSFYEWSHHMFLWLTSPAPAIYGGGGGRIFESSAFFDVSPPDANGHRTMVAHGRGLIKLGPIARQVGPNRLPLIADKQGRLFEVEPLPDGVLHPQVHTGEGKFAEVFSAKRSDAGKLILFDHAGKHIEPKLLEHPLRSPLAAGPVGVHPVQIGKARKFVLNRIPIFVDRFGNVIDVEQGEADGSVLIAQNGSPIYYGIAVNEVLAYFRTMQGSSVPANLLFPTTQGELDNITTFASAHSRTFVDPEALAFEIKTSWIETTGLANVGDYITMTAEVPTYDKSDPLTWKKTGTKNTQVALLGMHVVGSTAGHPEMIWATFEHVGNTANDAYSYRNSGGGTTSMPVDTAGNWLFTASNSTGPFNVKRQTTSGDNIVAVSSSTPVGPDNIIRRKAWGAASDVSPNPLKTPSASNSEIISVNNSVRSVLVNGDVRGNYIMTGSTWMIAGAFPFNSFNSTQVGTSRLNNTTMETFTQGPSTQASGTFNCFTCHGGHTTGVSHVFSDLKPLF